MTRLLLMTRCFLQILTMSVLPGPFWLDKLMSELRSKRPEHIRPPMNRSDRAKQFAPFASLGRMDSMLKAVEDRQDVGDPEHIAWLNDLSDEEMNLFSAEALNEDTEIHGSF